MKLISDKESVNDIESNTSNSYKKIDNIQIFTRITAFFISILPFTNKSYKKIDNMQIFTRITAFFISVFIYYINNYDLTNKAFEKIVILVSLYHSYFGL